MGIFGRFRKREPAEVYDAIAADIVGLALGYRKYVETDNNQYSADAGAEMAYFLLHVLDRELDKQGGIAGRDEIFDKIATKVLAGYIKAAMKAETPRDLLVQVGKEMFDRVNERQRTYSMCKSLMFRLGSEVPTKAVTFALSFYIHKALRKTTRDNVDEIILGRETVDRVTIADLPDIGKMVEVQVYAVRGAIESVKVWRKAIANLPCGGDEN